MASITETLGCNLYQYFEDTEYTKSLITLAELHKIHQTQGDGVGGDFGK